MGQSLKTHVRLTEPERQYLLMGLLHQGNKLPIFDDYGQEISHSVIQSCIRKGLSKPWFANPMHPNWRVCRLTELGLQVISP